MLHVTGPEIVPSSVYSIKNVAVTCMGIEETCPNVSPALEVATTRWGDVVDLFNPPSSTQQPDIADVAALVNKFKNVPGAPIKAQAVQAGNVPDLTTDVDFTQISACVNAYKGLPYPYPGPGSCP